MKIKILKEIPVQLPKVPPVGSVHDVIDIKREHNTVYVIKYNGAAIGIFGRECEVIADEEE